MDRFTTRPFIHWSLATSLIGGFGLGGAAFAALLFGVPAGAWWPAVAQAHGHAQLFGFAGLMIFGVAFIFLPRLRGTPLRGARAVPLVLVLFGGGVWLRFAIQSAVPFLPPGGAQVSLLRPALVVSGVLELAGATLGLALLVVTGRSGPPLRQRAGVMQVLPLLITAWSGLLLALVVNAAALVAGPVGAALPAGQPGTQMPLIAEPSLDSLSVHLAFLAWIVPLSVAFSARNFPLFLWTRVPSGPDLRLGLGALVAGLLLWTGAWAFGYQILVAGAALFQGWALLWWTYVIGALRSKVRPPGRTTDPLERALFDLSRGPLIAAYAWLGLTGLLMWAGAFASLAGLPPPPADVERHALGAGFVFLLITGMALRLIPGFGGGKRQVNLRAAGIAVWAAQAAALLRVVPPLVNWLLGLAGLPPLPGVTALLSLSGLSGILAIAALWVALWRALQLPARSV